MSHADNMKGTGSMARQCRLLLLIAFCSVVTLAAARADQQQKCFASPEEAVQSLITALSQNDTAALGAIFGPGSAPLVSSGDPVADQAGREKFAAMYEKKNKIDSAEAGRATLVVGEEEWPFPIPVVKAEAGWFFDTAQGIDEVLARRIGRNELDVIQVCLAYVDAQREYAAKDRDGDGLLAYARKFASDPGKQDGLYWETKDGETPSPLGSLVLAAQAGGYGAQAKKDDAPRPYHGYFYRILEGQGANAPGGAYDYVVNNAMIGGFALVAYPAEYGNSGVMTFMVNHDGTVYQKDLGGKTGKLAAKMKLFDPDSTWKKVEAGAPYGK